MNRLEFIKASFAIVGLSQLQPDKKHEYYPTFTHRKGKSEACRKKLRFAIRRQTKLSKRCLLLPKSKGSQLKWFLHIVLLKNKKIFGTINF